MAQCNGHCSGCRGCSGAVELTQMELEFLRRLGEIPFLPVARKPEDETPVFLEDTRHTREEYGLILLLLERKGLISLDYDKPLTGFDDSAYQAYPLRGSIALTARGQQALDSLDYWGASEE